MWRPFRPTVALRTVWRVYLTYLVRVHRSVLRGLGTRLDAATGSAVNRLSQRDERALERAARGIVEGVDETLKRLPRIRVENLGLEKADSQVAEFRRRNVMLIKTIGREH